MFKNPGLGKKKKGFYYVSLNTKVAHYAPGVVLSRVCLR